MAFRPPPLPLLLALAGCAREPEPTPAAKITVPPAVTPAAVKRAAVTPPPAVTPPAATPPAGTPPAGTPAAGTPAAGTTSDEHHRLHPGEGTLAITLPAQIATQHAATVTLTLTAGPGFRVNADFPIRLALVPPPGLAIAKPALTRADAVASDDNHVVLAPELVVSEPGSYAVTGRFKFALCQRGVCLSKDEPIAIELTAR